MTQTDMAGDAPIHDEALREHTFDGIREFDNRLPNWWLWTFYLACIFSFGYWWHFHIVGMGDLPRANYHQEMEAAEARLMAQLAKMDVTDASLMTLAGEPTAVEKGKQIFVTNCAQCHKPDGRGDVGPNLTDKYWLHGSKPTDLYEVVTHGVEGKAMVSWLPTLGPLRCQQVVAYLMTIRNTNVEGGKAPEGEPADQ